MNAIMFDLETLDNKPGAVITSIGAVRFDPRSDWLGETFHQHISIEDSQRHGLTISGDTVLWWLQQNDEAVADLIAGQEQAITLSSSLYAFLDFIGEPDEIWCNGTSFDFPILTHALRAIDVEPPLKYWQERDLRTLKALNKGASIERQSTHHNALADALHQARLVQHILQLNPDLDS